VDELLEAFCAMPAKSDCLNESATTAATAPGIDEIMAENRAGCPDGFFPDETPSSMESLSLIEASDEPESPIAVGRAKTKADKPLQKQRAGKILSSILFYIILVAAISVAFLYGAKPGARNFLGYTYADILTRSMQSEIPQGSLVLVKHVDPAAIKVGDIVTYIRPDNTTVTHKVMTIYEDYEQSGQRAFVTKGVDNPDADPDAVYAKNVIGVVQSHIANAGTILANIANHTWVIAGIFIILLLLSVTLRIFFSESKCEKTRKEKELKYTREIAPTIRFTQSADEGLHQP